MAARFTAMRDGFKPCELSHFLVHLGSSLQPPKPDPTALATYDGFDVYPVTIQDIWNIRKAIDSYSKTGTLLIDTTSNPRTPRFNSVSHATAAYSRSQNPHVQPSGPAELQDYQKRSWIHQLRLFARARNEKRDTGSVSESVCNDEVAAVKKEAFEMRHRYDRHFSEELPDFPIKPDCGVEFSADLFEQKIAPIPVNERTKGYLIDFLKSQTPQWRCLRDVCISERGFARTNMTCHAPDHEDCLLVRTVDRDGNRMLDFRFKNEWL